MSIETILQMAVFPLLFYVVKQNGDLRERVILMEERLEGTRQWLKGMSKQLGFYEDKL